MSRRTSTGSLDTGEPNPEMTTVAKGGAVQLLGLVTQRGLALGFIAVAVRLLGIGAYGLYRQVYQILQIGVLIAPGGFQWAGVHFISRARALGDHGKVRGTARTCLIGAALISTALCVGLFAGSRALGSVLEETPKLQRQLSYLLRVGAFFIPLYGLATVFRNFTHAYKTLVPSVLVDNVIQPLAWIGISLTAIWFGYGVTGAVWGLTSSAGVALIAAVWYYRRMLTPEELRATPSADVRKIIRFALPQGGVNLFNIQALGLGVVIIGISGSDRDVGLFALALSIQSLATIFLTGIVNIWAPVVSELHSQDKIERLGALYKTINRWIATFSFPAFALLIIEPSLVTRIFAGKGGLAASELVAVLALGNIFYVASGPSGILISMTGRPGVSLANAIVGIALYLGFGIWIVPRHGAVSMAIIDSGVTAVMNIARVVEARIFLGIHPYGKSFAKPVVATLAASAVLVMWNVALKPAVSMKLAGVALAGVVYLLVLYLFGVDPEEKYVFDRIRSRLFKAG